MIEARAQQPPSSNELGSSNGEHSRSNGNSRSAVKSDVDPISNVQLTPSQIQTSQYAPRPSGGKQLQPSQKQNGRKTHQIYLLKHNYRQNATGQNQLGSVREDQENRDEDEDDTYQRRGS